MIDYTARSDTYLQSNALARSRFAGVKNSTREQDIDYMHAIDELNDSDDKDFDNLQNRQDGEDSGH